MVAGDATVLEDIFACDTKSTVACLCRRRRPNPGTCTGFPPALANSGALDAATGMHNRVSVRGAVSVCCGRSASVYK